MRVTRTSLRLAGAASVGVLALGACGGGDESTEGTGPAGEDTTGAPPPGETAGDEESPVTAPSDGDGTELATATLQDPEGNEVGTVTFARSETGTEVVADVNGLEQGFHGFHVHGTGACEPDSADPENPDETGDFLSAGGHLGGDEADHGEHAGDLPPLYVSQDGHGHLATVTDLPAVGDLLDGDGSAVVVHADPDNLAHVPERYDGPDQDTLDAGDAGDRVACGVVEETGS